MVRPRALPLALAFLVAVTAAASAGTLEDNLSAYTDATAEGYLKPIQKAFGQALNSNLFTTASLPTLGFHANIGVKAMSVFFDSDDETFEATTGGDFDPPQTAEVSTVVGPTEAVVVNGTGGTQYVFPGGFDIGSLTVAVPQLTVTGLGSEAVLRWVGFSTNEDDIGNVTLLGLGFRHSITPHVPAIPFDLAAAIYYHKFDVESDLLDATAWSFGVQASRGLGLLTVYGGLSYDTFGMSAEYTSNAGSSAEEEIRVEMETEGTIHAVAGAALGLGFVRANLAGDLGTQFGVSAGLTFGF